MESDETRIPACAGQGCLRGQRQGSHTYPSVLERQRSQRSMTNSPARKVVGFSFAGVLVLSSLSVAIGQQPDQPLTPRGESLRAMYSERLASLAAEISARAPVVEAQKKAAFIEAHAAVAQVPAPPNPTKQKVAPPRYAISNPAYEESPGASSARSAVRPAGRPGVPGR